MQGFRTESRQAGVRLLGKFRATPVCSVSDSLLLPGRVTPCFPPLGSLDRTGPRTLAARAGSPRDEDDPAGSHDRTVTWKCSRTEGS